MSGKAVMTEQEREQQLYKDFDIASLPAIWDLTFKQEWLVDNLIPRSAVTMLSGESGCGKSTFTLALADAVAKGEPFLGYDTTKTPVLILDKENGLPIYHERLPRFNITRNDNLFIWGNWVNIAPPGPHIKRLYEYVSATKPLIIYDSFVAFHPGSEQDATETRQYMDNFRIMAGLGASILLIHHTGKGESTKAYRGSSDIKASVDVMFVMNTKRPRLELIELVPEKIREGTLDKISLAVEGTNWVRLDHEFIKPTDPDWIRITEIVKRNPGSNQSKLFKLLDGMNITQPRVRKILKAGELNGTFIVSKGENNASIYSLGTLKQAQG
jgi:RecA-family ATPase